MTDAEQDALWLEVLAGRSEGVDATTRQAGQLRSYFNQRTRLELDDRLDDATQIRSMNYLRAKGAFAASTTGASAARQGLWARWFAAPASRRDGPGRGWSSRVPAFAALALAVVAAPLLWMQLHDDDRAQMKGVVVPANGAEQVLRVASPAETALAIQGVLQAHQVPTQLIAEGADVRVVATVPASRATEIGRELAMFGVRLPVAGALALRLRAPP